MSDYTLRQFQWGDVPAITAIYKHYVENTAITFDTEVPSESAIAEKYADGHVYHLDGVSVEYPDWHLNVRKSNTEPLLRLNLEGVTREIMEQRRDEVLGIIRG